MGIRFLLALAITMPLPVFASQAKVATQKALSLTHWQQMSNDLERSVSNMMPFGYWFLLCDEDEKAMRFFDNLRKNVYQPLVLYPLKKHDLTERETTLIVAVKNSNIPLVRTLLFDEHINPNMADSNGITPLMWAILRQNKETFRYLLLVGADVDAQDKHGFTPIMQIASLPYTSMRFVMMNVLLYLTTSKIDAAIRQAQCHGNQFLEQYITMDSCRNFMKAVSANNLHEVKALLAGGADVNARDCDDDEHAETPLIRAALYSSNASRTNVFRFAVYPEDSEIAFRLGPAFHHPGFKESTENHRAIMKSLIEAGADLNAQNSLGITALIAATMMGNVEDVKLLLAAGADITLKTHEPFPNNENALFFAEHSPKRDVRIFALLEAYRLAKDSMPIVHEVMSDCCNADTSRWAGDIVYSYLLPNTELIEENYAKLIAEEQAKIDREEKERDDGMVFTLGPARLKKQQSCCIIS